MKQQLAELLSLQEISGKVVQARRDIERLSIDVRNQKRLLDELKRRAEQVQAQRIEATKKADALQLNIEGAEQQIEKFKVQLNVTKHQKEYDAIQQGMLSRRADISKWEDEELDALQAVDDLRSQQERLAQEIADAERDLQRIQDGVARDAKQLTEHLLDLEAQEAHKREKVNPDVLAAYQRLSASRPHNALAEVRGRICQGCHTQITKQTENLLMRGVEIVYCHSCGRMLILTDEA